MAYTTIQRESKIDNIPFHINNIKENGKQFLSVNNLPGSNNAVIYNFGACRRDVRI